MTWTTATLDELKKKFHAITSTLPERMKQITRGKTAPSLGNLPIGSAKEVNAVVLFFDIVGFTKRESTDEPADLVRTLWTLNCVIPMMMHVIHDHGGYVEKNTGDGMMALFDAEDGHDTAACLRSTLRLRVSMFFAKSLILTSWEQGLRRCTLESVSIRVVS
jgi:class 3 adenylate cyclase